MAELTGTLAELLGRRPRTPRTGCGVTVTDRTRPDQLFDRVKARFPHVLQVHAPPGRRPPGRRSATGAGSRAQPARARRRLHRSTSPAAGPGPSSWTCSSGPTRPRRRLEPRPAAADAAAPAAHDRDRPVRRPGRDRPQHGSATPACSCSKGPPAPASPPCSTPISFALYGKLAQSSATAERLKSHHAAAGRRAGGRAGLRDPERALPDPAHARATSARRSAAPAPPPAQHDRQALAARLAR